MAARGEPPGEQLNKRRRVSAEHGAPLLVSQESPNMHTRRVVSVVSPRNGVIDSTFHLSKLVRTFSHM